VNHWSTDTYYYLLILKDKLHYILATRSQPIFGKPSFSGRLLWWTRDRSVTRANQYGSWNLTTAPTRLLNICYTELSQTPAFIHLFIPVTQLLRLTTNFTLSPPFIVNLISDPGYSGLTHAYTSSIQCYYRVRPTTTFIVLPYIVSLVPQPSILGTSVL
jgi:hypothetical protein